MTAKRGKSDTGTKRLFRNPSGQEEMFEKSYEEELERQARQEVECLGLKFENDAARRAYFLDRLREELKDPEFRKIEGFPIGSDEDILRISDPPFYTACPNPFLQDFVRYNGKPYDPNEAYSREPFASDVSEGKNDPIYNAHSYHTKVPHKAIMRYVLHYTKPGDLVFDGFCGTGMAGVAAGLCSDPLAIGALGFTVEPDGRVVDQGGNVISHCGSRVPILNDLSPAATLIAAGYNLTTDARSFARYAKILLDKFNHDYGWMYETQDPRSSSSCPIDFTVWSEMFSCPECSGELEYWDLAYDESSGTIADELKCPHCTKEVSKRDLTRSTETFFDKGTQKTRTRQLLKPVEIRYQQGTKKKRKKPDQSDFGTLKKVEKLIDSVSYPTELMMFVSEGKEWGDLYRGYHEGISRVHDFSLTRQLVSFSLLWGMSVELPTEEMKRLWRFMLQSVVVSFTRRNRFLKNAYSQVNRALSGTLYIGSTISEPSPTYVLSGKIKRFGNAIPRKNGAALVTTESLAGIDIPSDSIDYVFIDPPFGDNLPYAELNFLWEAWLRVFTNASQDTVVSGTQKKDLIVYTDMMTSGPQEGLSRPETRTLGNHRIPQFEKCSMDGHPGGSWACRFHHC